jgi:hypothetical protein
LALIGVASYSFGQGQIQFYNSSSAATKMWVTTTINAQSTAQVTTGNALMAGSATTSYTFLLFVNSTTNSGVASPNVSGTATPWSTAGWAATGDYGLNGALGGRFTGVDNGGSYEVIPSGLFANINLVAGIYGNFEIIAWNTAVGGANLGTFETAYNTSQTSNIGLVFGYSGVANVELGDNGATIPNSNPFGAATGQITGFTLAPVAPIPEPSTMLLAGLGGLSLLLIRRRK